MPLIPACLLLSFRLTAPYPACRVSRVGLKGFVHFYPDFQQRAKAAPAVRGESGKYRLMILAACVLVAPFKQPPEMGVPRTHGKQSAQPHPAPRVVRGARYTH